MGTRRGTKRTMDGGTVTLGAQGAMEGHQSQEEAMVEGDHQQEEVVEDHQVVEDHRPQEG